MKSLDLSTLTPASRDQVTESMKGVTFLVEAGKLRVSTGARHPAGSTLEAIENETLAELQAAACRGIPDGLYGIGDADVVRPLPVRNPFEAGTFNLTQQLTMRRDDPEMAARCQATVQREPNPFDRASEAFNITQQIAMQRGDPERAARLKAAAGR